MKLKPVYKDVKDFKCNDLYLQSVGAPSGKSIWQACHSIAQMLIEKNIAYGDSALDPVRIFSKSDPAEQLKVRIDDKLSRLMKGTDYPGDNDIDDLIGYLVLLKIAKEKMSTETELIEHLDEVNKVVTEYLKGQDPTKISKELDIPRTRVVSLINEWKVMASANDAIRARAKEALAGADTHYTKLITKAYEVIDESSMTNNLSAKTQAIKLVMDIEKSRIEMLQKAGLLENKELAEEMVEIERRQEVLVEILRDIASTHPEVRDLIMRRLSQIAKEGEVITIVQDVQ